MSGGNSMKKEEIIICQLKNCLACQNMKKALSYLEAFQEISNQGLINYGLRKYQNDFSKIASATSYKILLECIQNFWCSFKLTDRSRGMAIWELLKKIEQNCLQEEPDFSKLKNQKRELRSYCFTQEEFGVVKHLCETFHLWTDLSFTDQCVKIFSLYSDYAKNKFCDKPQMCPYENDRIASDCITVRKCPYENDSIGNFCPEMQKRPCEKERLGKLCLICFFYIADSLSRLIEKNPPKDFSSKKYFKTILQTMEERCNKRKCDEEEYNVANTFSSSKQSNLSAAKCKEVLEQFRQLNLKNFNDPAKINCENKTFCQLIEGLKPNKEEKAFWMRVTQLEPEMQEIMKQFLKKAPKSSGKMLSLIMDAQQLTDNDVASFLNGIDGVTRGASHIQKWRTSEEWTTVSDEIQLLSRALLVSEDVIKYGNGIRYGSWTSINQTICDQRLYEQTSEPYKKREWKKTFYETVNYIIQQDKEKYEKIIKEELLLEAEEVNLFENREWRYISYILHKEEAQNLLEILEAVGK